MLDSVLFFQSWWELEILLALRKGRLGWQGLWLRFGWHPVGFRKFHVQKTLLYKARLVARVMECWVKRTLHHRITDHCGFSLLDQIRTIRSLLLLLELCRLYIYQRHMPSLVWNYLLLCLYVAISLLFLEPFCFNVEDSLHWLDWHVVDRNTLPLGSETYWSRLWMIELAVFTYLLPFKL